MTLLSMFLENNSVSHTVKINENGVFVNCENRESCETKKSGNKTLPLKHF